MTSIQSPVKIEATAHSAISSEMQPPVFEPITPQEVSERWFPKGRSFGLFLLKSNKHVITHLSTGFELSITGLHKRECRLLNFCSL